MSTNGTAPERLVPGTEEWTIFKVEHQQRYEFFAPRCQNLDILDAACGVGYGSHILARSGARSVLGVDISAEAVDFANEHYQQPNLAFKTCDVEQLNILGRQFDLIVSFETIEHVPNPQRFIAEVHRSLKPEGTFICSTPNKNYEAKANGKHNPYHLSEMTYTQFVEAMSYCFDIREQFYQTHSPAYLRHLQLLKEIHQTQRTVRFSKFLALENKLRGLLGKEKFSTGYLSADLARAVPGDYVIVPMKQPCESNLTFVLVGQAR
jgi:2-polyprenyl-3-methyl-5-hydroxy-6-metoxy-1,4-benzoquinol methylase